MKLMGSDTCLQETEYNSKGIIIFTFNFWNSFVFLVLRRTRIHQWRLFPMPLFDSYHATFQKTEVTLPSF